MTSVSQAKFLHRNLFSCYWNLLFCFNRLLQKKISWRLLTKWSKPMLNSVLRLVTWLITEWNSFLALAVSYFQEWIGSTCVHCVTKVAFPMKFQIFCFVIFKIIFFLLKICHHKRLLFATTKFLFGWTKVASERGAFLDQCIRTNGFFHLKKLVKNSLYGTISSLCCDDFLLEKL